MRHEQAQWPPGCTDAAVVREMLDASVGQNKQGIGGSKVGRRTPLDVVIL